MTEPRLNPVRRSWFAVWHLPWWVLFLTVITCMVISYATLYSLYMTRTFSMDSKNRLIYVDYYPSVRVAWRSRVSSFFEPANKVDRWLRPKYWEYPPTAQAARLEAN